MEYFATFNAAAVYTDQDSGEVHTTPIPFGRVDLDDYPELTGFTREFLNVQQREPRSRLASAAIPSGRTAANPSPIIDEADLELRRLTRLVEQVHERKERLKHDKAMRKLRATPETTPQQSATGEVLDDEAATATQADTATPTVDQSEPGNV